MVITEDIMKENRELWLYYIWSLLLTKDTSNRKNIKYKMIRKMIGYSNDSLYISPDYCDADIYDVTIPKVFKLSSDFYVNKGMKTIDLVR
jgi:hypothetical protein